MPSLIIFFHCLTVLQQSTPYICFILLTHLLDIRYLLSIFSAFFLFRVQDLIKYPDALLGTQHRFSSAFSAKVQTAELWLFMTRSLLSMHCLPLTLSPRQTQLSKFPWHRLFLMLKISPLLSLIYSCFPLRV